MGTLYIVATPIGNLKDITLRALEVLKGADVILCEDTRLTRKLLDHYTIQTPVISYHQHSSPARIDEIFRLLEKGSALALVSDAGTPGISDPGNKLIHLLVNKFIGSSQKASLETQSESEHKNPPTIVPIPGPSAVSAAASISGFPMDKFLFLGYPPTKKKRNKFFQEIAKSSHPVVCYESPHRILKTLEELRRAAGGGRSAVVCRELTKKFESIYRGTIDEVTEHIQRDPIKGEYTVVVAPQE